MTTQTIATPLEATVMAIDTNEISRKRLWAGRILTGLLTFRHIPGRLPAYRHIRVAERYRLG